MTKYEVTVSFFVEADSKENAVSIVEKDLDQITKYESESVEIMSVDVYESDDDCFDDE